MAIIKWCGHVANVYAGEVVHEAELGQKFPWIAVTENQMDVVIPCRSADTAGNFTLIEIGVNFDDLISALITTESLLDYDAAMTNRHQAISALSGVMQRLKCEPLQNAG